MSDVNRISDQYGPEIAAEVSLRMARLIADGDPALLRYLDTLPDYFARRALYSRELKERRARHSLLPSATPEAGKPHRRRQRETEPGNGHVRGTAHPSARLTDDQVRAIRSRRSAGESTAILAADFGVSRRTINLILSGKRWAHVSNEPEPATQSTNHGRSPPITPKDQ